MPHNSFLLGKRPSVRARSEGGGSKLHEQLIGVRLNGYSRELERRTTGVRPYQCLHGTWELETG